MSWPARGSSWWVPAIVLGVVSILALAFPLSPGFHPVPGRIAAFLADLDAAGVRDWILSSGAWAPLLYFLSMVAQVIFAPVPAGPLTLAGALVFGVWKGLALSIAGSVVGSAMVFAAARRWGKPLVIRLVGKGTFYRYAGRLDDRGWWVFLIMLVPFMPDDAVSALAGLSAVSFGRFFAAMAVGRLPGTTLTALLASNVLGSQAATWITIGLVLLGALVFGLVYRERLESWILGRAEAGMHREENAIDPIRGRRSG